MKKSTLQKVAIAMIMTVSTALLIAAMFFPESNRWANAWLVGVGALLWHIFAKLRKTDAIKNSGYSFYKKDHGEFLGAVAIVGALLPMFGIASQTLFLFFAENITMTGSNSIICLCASSWMFFLTACNLTTQLRFEKNKLTRTFLTSGIVWMFSVQIFFISDVLELFGRKLPHVVMVTGLTVFQISGAITLLCIVAAIMRAAFKS